MAASEGPLCVVTYVYGLEECLPVLGRKKGREVGREDGKRADRKDRMKRKTGSGGVVKKGKKADKSTTPTIALKLQIHDTLSPDIREHVHHLRINGSCNERLTRLQLWTTHQFQQWKKFHCMFLPSPSVFSPSCTRWLRREEGAVGGKEETIPEREEAAAS